MSEKISSNPSKIFHSSSNITKADIENAVGVLERNYVGRGDVSHNLEQVLGSFFEKEYCRVVSNGNIAIYMSLLMLKERYPNRNEVITSGYLCPAVIHPILLAGLKPVVVDIGNDLNLNATSVLNRINKKTLSVIIPHLAGVPVNMTPFLELKDEVVLIEDCAQSIGSRVDDKATGFYGDIVIGSFGSTKMITGGAGGAVLTSNEEWSKSFDRMCEYDNSVELYKSSGFSTSFNSNISDLNSAIILSQLVQLEGFIKKRREIAKSYDEALKDKEVVVLKESRDQFFNRYRYFLLSSKSQIIIESLMKNGIDARPSIAHNLTSYKDVDVYDKDNIESLSETVVSLPIYPNLSGADLRYIVNCLEKL
jgi:dTDP-4-amino-4,6-dideoxygalactose transaminase